MKGNEDAINQSRRAVGTLRTRYQGRGPQGKAQLLDCLCEEFGYHRKHPGMSRCWRSWSRSGQRGEQPCGKRLVEMLPLWLPHYQRRYGRLLPSQQRLAREVSAATLDRLLASRRSQWPVRGLSGTKPGSLLRQQVLRLLQVSIMGLLSSSPTI